MKKDIRRVEILVFIFDNKNSNKLCIIYLQVLRIWYRIDPSIKKRRVEWLIN